MLCDKTRDRSRPYCNVFGTLLDFPICRKLCEFRQYNGAL